MNEGLGDLSDKQFRKLQKFKEALKDVHEDLRDDFQLLRFLKARRFNLKHAEDMFRKDLEWRKQMNVDKIVKEFVPPEVLTKYFGGGCIGKDKDGAMVYIQPFGKRDVKGLLKSCKASDLFTFMIQLYEYFSLATKIQNAKLGKDVGGAVIIYDLNGLSKDYFWKPWRDFMKKVVRLGEQHYPEISKINLIINAPKQFLFLYAIVKPWIREETKKKIVILGSDWRKQLVKYVDADILPAAYGGKREDPDGNPWCPSVVTKAKAVPKSDYIQGQDLSNRTLTTQKVLPTRTLELKYEVGLPGQVLSYEFRTVKADIGFSVKKINQDGRRVDVIVNERYNSHISPVEDHITLEEPGEYVVKFDNSYSYTRSKTLSYVVELLKPDHHADENEESADVYAEWDWIDDS